MTLSCYILFKELMKALIINIKRFKLGPQGSAELLKEIMNKIGNLMYSAITL